MDSRSKRKIIRVTFPDGQRVCYANVTTTMIDVLKNIGANRFPEIALELCHLPLISREVYSRYKEWMKPLCDGWYVNTQSDTATKFLQLKSINDQLQLGLVVELGYDFETQEKPGNERKSKTTSKLLVKFPDGEYVANESQTETFLEVIWKLGIENIRRRNIILGGNPLITLFKRSSNQVQIDTDRWISIPNTTKEKAKILKVIASHLQVKLEVNVI